MLCIAREIPVAIALGALLMSVGCAEDGQKPADDADSALDAGFNAQPALDAAGQADAAQTHDGGFDAQLPSEASASVDAAQAWPADAYVLPDGAVACGDPSVYFFEPRTAQELEGCVVFRTGIRFGDTQLTKIPFPTSLRHIEGTLNLFRNEKLVDISALHNLVSVGELMVHHNSELETLSGLEGLRRVRGQVAVASNSRLKNLNGLSNLETAGASMILGPNDALPDSEVQRLMMQVRIVDAGF